jgi:nucleoside-diphosphate-sugar epimerase
MDESIPNPSPNNRYGLSKLLGEKIVEYEVRNYGLRAVTIRPFMMYDEEEHFGNHRSAMIRFVGNLALGKPIEVHNGSARSWFHASDAVRAIEAAVHIKEYSVINIGHPDVITMAELAERVRAKLDAPKKLINYIDIPARMTLVKRPVLERQRTLLGVEPKVSLEEGIRRVCKRVPERIAFGEAWR